MVNSISKLFGIARRTYFHWKKDDNKNKAILLIEKYFKKEELEEFLDSNKISKMEMLNNYELNLNIELNKFYREKLDKQTSESRSNNRLFWDFINKYKNEIIEIDLIDCKSSLNHLFLKYHLHLREVCEKNEVSPTLATNRCSDFIATMQELSRDLTYFIITNIKYNFRNHVNYLASNHLYPYANTFLAYGSIEYYDDKVPFYHEVKAELFLNNYPTKLDKYEKDFYYFLEGYFKDYESNQEEVYRIITTAKDNPKF